MSAGGSAEPCETLQNAPILSSCSFSVEWTSQSRPTSCAMSAARWPRTVGVSLLPGSFTSERAKFWLSPTIDALGECGFDGLPVGFGGGGESEGLDALVFAIAAIGVGIEVADESALDGSRCAGCGNALE